MGTNKRYYGLTTAIAMIVGVVIGSGIFFKADDVLKYTGGNVWLGVLVFGLGAFSMIFGCLTIAELAIRSRKSGGAIGYYEEFVSEKLASGFGWFQMFIYLPALMSIIGFASGKYICSLLEISPTNINILIVGCLLVCIFYAINIASAKFAGIFQISATGIKLIPLLAIVIFGIFFTPSHPAVPAGITVQPVHDVGIAWLGALTAVAFSYDGWIVASGITNDVKNPKKTMPLAFTIGPIIVLFAYVFYFYGLSEMLGSEYIMSVPNYIDKAGQIIFGEYGSKILVVFILVSVLGGGNGVTLTTLRMPGILAQKNMMPWIDKTSEHDRPHFHWKSVVMAMGSGIAWLVIKYFTEEYKIFGKIDGADAAVAFTYICFSVLYIKVMMMRKSHSIGIFKGLICPILALFGASIVLIGGFTLDAMPMIILCLVCAIVVVLGYNYHHKFDHKDKSNVAL